MPSSDSPNRQNHFSAVLLTCRVTTPEQDPYRVVVLRRNGRIANTGRGFSTRQEARLFVEGLDMQARIMSDDGKTRVLLTELSEEESEDFAREAKHGSLTKAQTLALQGVKAGKPFAFCHTVQEITCRNRVINRLIDRRYVRGEMAPPHYSPETAQLYLTPEGEKALQAVTSSDEDDAVGLARLNPPGLR
jgi:hypothetical protein